MDYTQLPDDIVVKIASHHLHTFSQLLAFSHICKSWRSAALSRPDALLCLPGLLFPTTKPPAAASSRDWKAPHPHEFLPLTVLNHRNDQQQSERTLPQVTLPHFLTSRSLHISRSDAASIQKEHYVASKDGWLLIVPAPTFPIVIYLLNPLTESSLHLPPLPLTARRHNIRKAIISSSPDRDDDEDCHVFLLLDSTPRLAWCNVAKGGCWKFTSRHDDELNFDLSKDVGMAYLGGKLHVADREHVYVVDGLLTCATPTVRVFPIFSVAKSIFSRPSVRSYDDDCSYHLANLRDELLVILHHVVILHHLADEYWFVKPESKHEFEVYKLVLGGGEKKNNSNNYWAKVTELDGYAMFVGSHQSFCLPADPLLNNGVKGNCIYFVFGRGEYDCGVFNLEDRTVERFAASDGDNNVSAPRTFWFLPMPWNIHEHKEGQERMFRQRQTGPGVGIAKSKTNYRKHGQQREGTNNKVSTGRLANKFQALLIDDDEDDDQDQDER